MKFAGNFFERFQHCTERFLFYGDQLRHEQAGENSIFLWNVTFHTKPAGFLAADNDRFAFHERADVFETNWRFVNFYAQHFGDCIDLMARGHGADHRAGPAAILFK